MTSYAAVADETGTTNGPSAPSPALAMAETKSRGRETQVLRVKAAGFPRRLAAAIVDVLLVVSLSIAVSLGAALALGVHMPTLKELGPDLLMAGLLDRNPMAVGALGLLFGLSALYQIYLGGVLGQTLGKKLLGLRVISSRGRMPGPLLASVRFFAMVLSLGLAGLGFVWCLFDRERRALHDHLSCTYVILDER